MRNPQQHLSHSEIIYYLTEKFPDDRFEREINLHNSICLVCAEFTEKCRNHYNKIKEIKTQNDMVDYFNGILEDRIDI